MHVVGLDIGGANIKAASNDGHAVSRPFPFWKEADRFPDVLTEILAQFDNIGLIAVIMTAELADCFETKAAGVHSVLDGVEKSANGTPIVVWQTGAEFVEPAVAREIPMLVAAANWHALATWVARLVPAGPALLIDVGSTTTDIIPIIDGVPLPYGLTDRDRLLSGELVYSGVRRTPVCAVAIAVPFRDTYCPMAAELFATTDDVYLTLGQIEERPDDRDTSDGRPATKAGAASRLARMLCCDTTECTPDDALLIARHLASVQKLRISGQVDRVLKTAGIAPDVCQLILSGSGQFLAEQIVTEHHRLQSRPLHRLSAMFGPHISETACAQAVARLADEHVVR